MNIWNLGTIKKKKTEKKTQRAGASGAAGEKEQGFQYKGALVWLSWVVLCCGAPESLVYQKKGILFIITVCIFPAFCFTAFRFYSVFSLVSVDDVATFSNKQQSLCGFYFIFFPPDLGWMGNLILYPGVLGTSRINYRLQILSK